jgi:hypothetical protein
MMAEKRSNGVRIRNGFDGENVCGTDSREVGDDRSSPRCKDEFVVRLVKNFTRLQAFDLHLLVLTCDLQDLVTNLDRHTKPFPKCFGGLKEELLTVRYGLTDIVGQPAIRKGHIGAFFEYRDFSSFIGPASFGRSTRSARHTPYDNDLHDFPG